MAAGIRTALASGLLALPNALALAGPAPAGADRPLTPAGYRVVELCPAPAPGRAACLGLGLVARAPLSPPGARALPAPRGSVGAPAQNAQPAVEYTEPQGGIAPANLRGAYGLGGAGEPASIQTVAIVDAYDDPGAESDLARFDSQYGLSSCTQAGGCFRKLNEEGNASPLPSWKGESGELGWALEIATDVETVHSICPACHILLVEARSNSDSDLFAAEQAAAAHGATEITNSWGGGEPGVDSPAFNHPGIVITASAGDNGYDNWLVESKGGADYPASSPHVVAVGGTRLQQLAGSWQGESVWNDGAVEGGTKTGYGAGGGGCSAFFSAPSWQSALSGWSAIGCAGKRAVADVSADGDPFTGVNVYDSAGWSGGNKGWTVVGGTSVASPIIASVFALAGGAHGVAYPARTLYESAAHAPASLHDVTTGSNGECDKPLSGNGSASCASGEEAASCAEAGICLAGAGYDGPTGVGTPEGLAAFQPGAVGKEAGAGGKEAPPSSEESAAGGSGSGAEVPSQPPVSVTPQPPPARAAARPPTVSGLALTRGALIALHRPRPRVSQIGYVFTLRSPVRVTVYVTVWRWVRVDRRWRWKRIARPLRFAASAGRINGHLRGRAVVGAGRYRLAVALAEGVGGSLAFSVRSLR